MKIRTGFISNSSSSSFVIAYDTSKIKKCEICGYTPLNLFEILDNPYIYNLSENTQLIDRNVIKNLETEIQTYNNKIDIYNKQYLSQIVNKELEWLKNDLENAEKLLELIKKEIKNNNNIKILEIDIDYHDKFINEIFNMQKKQGIIKILKEY